MKYADIQSMKKKADTSFWSTLVSPGAWVFGKSGEVLGRYMGNKVKPRVQKVKKQLEDTVSNLGERFGGEAAKSAKQNVPEIVDSAMDRVGERIKSYLPQAVTAIGGSLLTGTALYALSKMFTKSKALRGLFTVGGAALGIPAGLYVYDKFFKKASVNRTLPTYSEVAALYKNSLDKTASLITDRIGMQNPAQSKTPAGASQAGQLFTIAAPFISSAIKDYRARKVQGFKNGITRGAKQVLPYARRALTFVVPPLGSAMTRLTANIPQASNSSVSNNI